MNNVVSIEQHTLAATNASVTNTNAASLYIGGPPAAGTNMTLTNRYALWVDAGLVKFDGTLTVDGTITGALTGNADTATTAATVTTAAQPNIESIGTDGDTTQLLGDILYMANTTANKPEIKLVNTTDDTTGPFINFWNSRTDGSIQAGEDNDVLGNIDFWGYDDAGTPGINRYAHIYADIHDATAGEESGRLTFQVANHDSGLGSGLILTGGSADNEVDVTLGLGAASVVTIPGQIDLGISNTSGKRYGSTIKILPSDFMINDDAASPLSFKDGSNSGVHVNDAANEVVAFVTIPEGMKATLVDVYGTHNKTLKVWAPDLNASFDFTGTTLGTGAMNTQLDITDTNATATNYLAIQVTLTATSQRIWGGVVTIAPQ